MRIKLPNRFDLIADSTGAAVSGPLEMSGKFWKNPLEGKITKIGQW